jgi:hypothetical protein
VLVKTQRSPQDAQAWVWLRADDPEAVSARTVARRALAAGRALASVRRFRLYEVCGALPARTAVEEMLHRSIQFYNPHKEHCAVRMEAGEAAPVLPGEQVVLVFDRGDERRAAAERWWSHVTNEAVEVREGVVWVLGFEPGVDAAAAAADLAVLRGQDHGLLCNPHAQESRLSGAEVPLPWFPRQRKRAPQEEP